MNMPLDTLCFISEQTSYPEDYSKDFGYQVTDKGNRFFVTFESVLQSFGIRNRNGREYDQNNIWNCIQTDEAIQDYLRRNAWIGELDHPAAILKGEELTMQRIAIPSMERDSHYIRKPRMEGNLLIATIQTDSGTEQGRNMAIKIVDGKMIPCFSARVLGSLKNTGGKAIVFVTKLITYDFVLFPSHREAEARIKQPLMESFQENADVLKNATNVAIIFFPELAQMAAASSNETKWLCESFGVGLESVVGLTSTGNSVVVQEGRNTYVQPITSDTVRRKTRSALADWLKK